MTSEWRCVVCQSTFSRPEHLRRHAASHDGSRQHMCALCGNSFNRKDVLRRHERTCKARTSPARQDPFELSEVLDIADSRKAKRRCSSADLHVVPDPLSQSLLDTANPSLIDCGVEQTQLPSISNPGMGEETKNDFQSEYEPSSLEDEIILFDTQVGHDLIGMASPLDFSALDCLLFPGLTSDILAAERLEYLAYFTSARGMATFTDRDSFLQRQKMATEAYEEKIKLGKRCKKETQPVGYVSTKNPQDVGDNQESVVDDFVDPLQAKSRELVSSLRAIICNKTKGDVIPIEWSKSTQELCFEFFSPANTRRFLEYFWSLWYPNCPIVHKPLFDAISVSPTLLCVMVIIGACLSPSKQDNETARIWLDSCEELIFSHKCFRADGAIPNDDVERREKIQCMQASYLVCSLQKREGSLEAQARIRRHRHASMVALARSIGPKTASHRNLQLDSPSQTWWKRFAEEEELIRTIIFAFLIDAALTILHNSPPRIVVSELRMDVACPEACFQAETAEECLASLRVWSGTRFWKKRLSVVSVVRRICQGPIDETLVQEFSNLGTLNLFTMVQAIHSLMFHLHSSLVFESTLAPVQMGLENWRRIWNERIPEDVGIPDTPDNLWKQVGFLRQASEFWHLARIIAGKIMSANHDDSDDVEEDQELSRYDHTDMGDVNGLIMEYRRLNLGVN